MNAAAPAAMPFSSEASRRGKRMALLLPNLAGGGAERVALAIAEDLLRRGHEVDLLLVEGRGELLDLVPPGARVVDFGKERLRGAIAPLAAYLREERPHGLQAFMWPLTVVAVMAHRLARSDARLVLADHGTLSKQYPDFLRARLLRSTVRFLYPLADARVAVSRGAAGDMAALSGLPAGSFEVVTNPVQLPEPARDEAVEALWQGAGERLLTVGNLKAVKNHALLIRAFARLRRHRPKARLMIVGEGGERPALQALARELGVADAVLLPGFVLDPTPYFASADLFVLSSDSEASPLVLVEALNAGLRIVSTDCENGPAEILREGRFGRLVRVGDAKALARAIDRSLAEERQPERQRARAAALSGQASLRRYEELMLGSGVPA